MPRFRITTDDGTKVQEYTVTAEDEAGARAMGRGFRRAYVTQVELVTDDENPAMPDPNPEQPKRLWPIFGGKESD